MAFTFRGGVHPRPNKHLSEHCEIGLFPPVEEVFLPLAQHIGRPAVPVVRAGDRVLKGQPVACAAEGLSAPVYSPVSGEVLGIVTRPTLFSAAVPHIHVKNDGKEEEVRLPALSDPSAEEIVRRIGEAGVVGMGGAGFPTVAKLTGSAETLLVNAAECEPYITCDYRLLIERTEEFLAGVRLLGKASGAKKILICVENNKPLALAALVAAGVPLLKNRKAAGEGTFVVSLKTKYPQGGEKQLVYAATGKAVPEGKLPSALGVLVCNVHTAYAVYEAVTLGKPLYERCTTLSGTGAKKPCNVWVKTGTAYAALSEFCGADENTDMVISGGPMMGFCAVSGKISVTKTTGALLFFRKEEFRLDPVGPCIGCGKCVSACPMRLMPLMIDQHAFRGDLKEAERYGAMQCMECGCCSFVCPAKRPLLQSIRSAKKKIREEKSRG